jgi:hypothetical protein
MASPLIAQQAVLTEWNIVAATGARNVMSLLVDATGATGTAGSVWVTTHNPAPRLGRLDPQTHTYTEWTAIITPSMTAPDGKAGTDNAGTPSGLTLNPANGDVWFTNTGQPLLVLKHGAQALENGFRKYRLVVNTTGAVQQVESHSVAVLSDSIAQDSVIVTAPTGGTQLRGIYRIFKGPDGPISKTAPVRETFTYWQFNSPEQPRHMKVDAGGFVWFVNRKSLSSTAGLLSRLDPRVSPATSTNQNLLEWSLPAGLNPTGLFIVNRPGGDPQGPGAQRVCVVSEATQGAPGTVQCLEVPALPSPITSTTTLPATPFHVYSTALDFPQQVAVSGAGELFVTEQRASAVSVLDPATAAFALLPEKPLEPARRFVNPVTPTNRSMSLYDEFIPGATHSVAPPPDVDLDATPVAAGHARYALGTGVPPTQPQPIGVSDVLEDAISGIRSVFVAEYFRGTTSNLDDARIARLALGASGGPRSLELDVTSITRTLTSGVPGSAVETVTVTDGGEPVAWAVQYAGACELAPAQTLGAEQLTLLPAGGSTQPPLTSTDTNQFEITATHALAGGGYLEPGRYCAKLTVSDEEADPDAAQPVALEFTLVVDPAPAILVDKASLLFTAVTPIDPDDLPASQFVTVSNIGGGTLDWTATLSTELKEWFRAVPDSSPLELAMHTVPPPGVKSGTLTVCSNGANVPPAPGVCTDEARPNGIAIPVTLAVSDLAVSPNSLTFHALLRGDAPPAQAIEVTDVGEGELGFEITPATQNGGAWLGATPILGETLAGSATVTVTALNKDPLTDAYLARGQYLGTITVQSETGAEPIDVPVTLNIQAPEITLDRTDIALAVIRTSSPGDESIAVGNSGDAPLNYAVTVTAGAAWLSIASGGAGQVPAGGAPSTLVLSFDTATLGKGRHTATVEVSDPHASEPSRTITITLDVQAPTIAVDATALTFTAIQGNNPEAQTLRITNSGDAPLTFTPTVAAGVPGGWLSVAPASQQIVGAGESVVLTVGVLSAALPAGASYAGSIAIADPTATNSPQVVDVSLMVNAGAMPSISPTTFTLSALHNGSDPGTLTVVVANSGGASFAYSTGAPTAGWLSVVSGGAGTVAPADSASLVLGIDTAGLLPGPYSASIAISSNALEAAQIITVNLTVEAPTITRTPSSLSLEVVRTAPGSSNETIVVGNVGTAVLEYTASVTSGGSWLSIAGGSTGVVAPGATANLVLAFNTTALTKGTYTGTVELADPHASNGPQVVAVTLVVRAPVIALSAATLPFTATVGSAVESRVVTVSNEGDAPLTFTPQVTAGTPGGWLSVSPGGTLVVPAGGSVQLTVAVDVESLSPDVSYAGMVAIADPTATNSPRAVEVTLAVNGTALEGRMTGGGFIDLRGARLHFRFHVRERAPQGERGFLSIALTSWCHGFHADRFVSKTVTSMTFSDDAGFLPGRRRAPSVDTVVFTGTGEWNGQPGYLYTATATDRGEPGRGRDTFAIEVRNPAGQVVMTHVGPLSVADVLDGGNIQSHRLKGRSVRPADAIAPEITAPSAIMEEAESAQGAKVHYRVSARDAESGRVDLTCSQPSGSVFPVGTTIVTCSASDDAGNVASVSFSVTVREWKPKPTHDTRSKHDVRDRDRDRDRHDRSRDRDDD